MSDERSRQQREVVTAPAGGKLLLDLEGVTVVVRVVCPDHYEAIDVYDRLCRSAAGGGIVLEVLTEPKKS